MPALPSLTRQIFVLHYALGTSTGDTWKERVKEARTWVTWASDERDSEPPDEVRVEEFDGLELAYLCGTIGFVTVVIGLLIEFAIGKFFTPHLIWWIVTPLSIWPACAAAYFSFKKACRRPFRVPRFVDDVGVTLITMALVVAVHLAD